MAEDGGDFAPDQVEDERFALGLRRRRRASRQASGPLERRRGARDQPAQQRRQDAGRGLGAQAGAVEPQRHRVGAIGVEGLVEEGEALLVAERGDSRAPHPRQLRLAEGSGHAAFALPQPPGDRCRRQAGGTAALGKGIEEGVGRRVVALAGDCPGPRRRRSRGRRPRARWRRSARAGARRRWPWGRRRARAARARSDSIVASSSAPAEWMTAPRGRSAGIEASSACSCAALGDVAGGDRHLGAELFQLRPQLGRPRGRLAAAADQEQVAGAVLGGQPARGEGPEAAGGAGDQDRLRGIDSAWSARPRRGARRQAASPRRQRHALAQGELGLLGRGRGRRRAPPRRPRSRRCRSGRSDRGARTGPSE